MKTEVIGRRAFDVEDTKSDGDDGDDGDDDACISSRDGLRTRVDLLRPTPARDDVIPSAPARSQSQINQSVS